MTFEEQYPVKLECPICGHHLNFIISKEATLKSLEDMNWKVKVRKAIDKVLETSMLNGKCYCDDLYEGECDNCKAKELKKELGI